MQRKRRREEGHINSQAKLNDVLLRNRIWVHKEGQRGRTPIGGEKRDRTSGPRKAAGEKKGRSNGAKKGAGKDGGIETVVQVHTRRDLKTPHERTRV